MGRRSTQGFLVEIAILGALVGGAYVERNTAVSGLYVIIPALTILVPLFFYNHMGPYGRRRKWRPRSNSWPHQRSKPQWPAWQVYSLAGLLMVAVFSIVFFWPGRQTTEAASFMPSGSFSCQVSNVHDGDTLRCADGTRVRLHAVAARETDETCSPGHPCPTASAASATAKLRELASGQTLTCQQTGNSYNQVTAICRNEHNVEINCAMVQSGTALIWPKFNQQRAICAH
jgi:endonuclease YncB( thermonuclease family)